MLRHYRRFWIIAIAILLVTPLTVGLLTPAADHLASAEYRAAAPPPALPRSLAEWNSLPREVDLYLADRFGLRTPMIYARALVAQGLLHSGNASVMIGRDGSLFYTADEPVNSVRQSAGLVLRRPLVAATADLLARVHAALAARSIPFLVAIPPNRATIYPDLLPRWARRRDRPSEYDLMLSALAARGIRAIDLRPVLRAVAERDEVYFRQDTHWNALGALVAFNAISAATGHPDWQVRPQVATVSRPDGDLARMLGYVGHSVEEIPELVLAGAPRELLSPEPRATFTTSRGRADHPVLLVLGDSFTEFFFTPLAVEHVGRYVWVHHTQYAFDWGWIDRLRPDEVWWMPTERYLLCPSGAQPTGLPQAAAAAR